MIWKTLLLYVPFAHASECTVDPTLGAYEFEEVKTQFELTTKKSQSPTEAFSFFNLFKFWSPEDQDDFMLYADYQDENLRNKLLIWNHLQFLPAFQEEIKLQKKAIFLDWDSTLRCECDAYRGYLSKKDEQYLNEKFSDWKSIGYDIYIITAGTTWDIACEKMSIYIEKEKEMLRKEGMMDFERKDRHHLLESENITAFFSSNFLKSSKFKFMETIVNTFYGGEWKHIYFVDDQRDNHLDSCTDPSWIKENTIEVKKTYYPNCTRPIKKDNTLPSNKALKSLTFMKSMTNKSQESNYFIHLENLDKIVNTKE